MNPENVIKKTGALESFKLDKIKEAIQKAANQAGRENAEEIANTISEEVLKSLEDKESVHTSEIEELILEKLTQAGYEDIVKAWEEYKHKKELELKE